MITYRQVLQTLQTLTDEQLDSPVTVCNSSDEYGKVIGLYFAYEGFNDHILKPRTPYLVAKV
jgi:GDP-D-mannose dehydratase